jgi:hypothetical protein
MLDEKDLPLLAPNKAPCRAIRLAVLSLALVFVAAYLWLGALAPSGHAWL